MPVRTAVLRERGEAEIHGRVRCVRQEAASSFVLPVEFEPALGVRCMNGVGA